MTSKIVDFAAFKRRRENPYDVGLNMDEELFAHSDGTVWPIREWRDADAQLCAKEDAAFGIAGGDDPNKGPWFCVHLGEFGLGPLKDHPRYKS